MNDPFAFGLGCLFIAIGFGTGLSCIGDGIKALAKTWKESLSSAKKSEVPTTEVKQ